MDSVAAGALVCGSLKGAPPSTNPSFMPVGRIVSIIGRPEGATPYLSGRVISWDKGTGTIGLTPGPNGIVQEGDCFVLRFNADSSNSASPTSITESAARTSSIPTG